jgi:excisionase family DNA binding protein
VPPKKNQHIKAPSAVVHFAFTTPPSFEPILTLEQVAERLQVKRSTIYELTRRRKDRPIPVLRVGKYLRFHWPEIERWLDECRQV